MDKLSVILNTLSILDRGLDAFAGAESNEKYLEKGEKLSSLAKDYSKRVLEKLALSDWEEALFDGKWGDSIDDMFSKLKSFIGKYLSQIQEDGDAVCKTVENICGVKLSILDSRSFVTSLLPYKVWSREPDMDVRAGFPYKGDYLYFGGVKNHAVNRKHFYLSGRHGYAFGCIRTSLAYMLVYHLIKSVVEDTEDYAHDLFLQEYEQRDSVLKVREWALRCVYSLDTGSSIYRFPEREYEAQRFYRLTLHVPSDVELPDKAAMYLRDMIAVVRHEETEQELAELFKEEPLHLVVTDTFVRNLFSATLPFFLSLGVMPPVSALYCNVRFGNGVYELTPPQRNAFSMHYDLLDAFRVLLKVRKVQMAKVREYGEMNATYAKSFQNRKNLPAATVERMKKSILNQYFGYVEFDEDVDFQKIEILEKQFQHVKDTYFPLIACKDVSIRFRKLGNHKASGLYYPFVKCMCVDFRYPGSFLHEFGHLIDATRGDLSLRRDFREVRENYKLALVSSVNKDRVVLKGKYNLDYYLKETEVFARSFEVYCGRCLGIENTLIKDMGDTIFYPKNKTYEGCVKAYFDTLFNRKEEQADEELVS